MNPESKHFVIQKHIRQADVHWDLMLEQGDCLQTWRIDTPPDKIGDDAVNAEKIFDHPLRFLTYEGAVNKSKGTVKIADRGFFTTIESNNNIITLEMNGNILQGKFCLKHKDNDNWTLIPIL